MSTENKAPLFFEVVPVAEAPLTDAFYFAITDSESYPKINGNYQLGDFDPNRSWGYPKGWRCESGEVIAWLRPVESSPVKPAPEVIEERDALQRFKDFVHRRLDEMGVATHPDGEHSKAGCRIGDRLDIVEGVLRAGDYETQALNEAKGTIEWMRQFMDWGESAQNIYGKGGYNAFVSDRFNNPENAITMIDAALESAPAAEEKPSQDTGVLVEALKKVRTIASRADAYDSASVLLSFMSDIVSIATNTIHASTHQTKAE